MGPRDAEHWKSGGCAKEDRVELGMTDMMKLWCGVTWPPPLFNSTQAQSCNGNLVPYVQYITLCDTLKVRNRG